LAGKNGSIDWCCLPRFGSPSIFGAILDDWKGGCFHVRVTGEADVKQIYLPNTNVLVTRFLAGASMAEVIDFMPVGRESGGHTEQESRQLVRIAKAIHGPARFQIECRPAFDYGRQRPEVHLDSDRRNALFISPAQQFALKNPYSLELCDGGVKPNSS
jgi:GH15 family glucan-1,4-alpha-glucosidase